jgi:hypothetical protein
VMLCLLRYLPDPRASPASAGAGAEDTKST